MTVLLRDMMVLDGSMDSATNCDVVVKDDSIAAIRPARSVSCDDADVVDGKGQTALLPGFVNGHTHAAMSLLRGLGEETPLKEWLEEQIWPVEANLTPERIYWGTKAALMEMASNGITCFADMYFEMNEVARAAVETGMRCGLARGLLGDDEKRLEENVEMIGKWKDEPLITIQLGPHAPYTVPPEFLNRITDIARERNVGVHFHFLEADWERSYLESELGLSPVEYLEKTGLLDTRSTLLAHCVWLSAEELGFLADKNVTVVHNPNSNLKLGSGIAPLKEMLDAGIHVSLGSDGAASNNRLDIFDEVRMAALLHKGVQRDPTIVKAKEILRCATYEGARSLGFEKVGMIREGWQADLVLVDLDRIHYVGFDPVNLGAFLVYAGSSADVCGTLVAGRWIYRNGAFLSGDPEEIKTCAATCRRELIEMKK